MTTYNQKNDNMQSNHIQQLNTIHSVPMMGRYTEGRLNRNNSEAMYVFSMHSREIIVLAHSYC